MSTRGSRKTAAARAILSPKLGFCIPSAAVMVLLHSRMGAFTLPQKHALPAELPCIMSESHAGAFHVPTISRRFMILGGTSAATLALGFPFRSAAREVITLDEFLALSSRLTGAPDLDATAAAKLLDGFLSTGHGADSQPLSLRAGVAELSPMRSSLLGIRGAT